MQSRLVSGVSRRFLYFMNLLLSKNILKIIYQVISIK